MTDDMDRSYFDSMYEHSADPWGFDTRFYERRKYDMTIAALTRPQYESAFEPGCSNGALTERLAPRCGYVVACDIVDDAVQRAQDRLERFEHVDVVKATFPAFRPSRPVDLVVWSEVAYYLGPSSLATAIECLEDRLMRGGDLVVVNYTGETNYPTTADAVDAQIERSGIVERHTSVRSDLFRLDVWRR
ncbi:MAG: SAM-dependent methyltransferase [Ilumatobacter sp.]|uniref:SAM-dependent methyltransferase n=1 Tax=Ilumatobacter sp. TaxID=1967498 RepID=UPI003C76D38B